MPPRSRRMSKVCSRDPHQPVRQVQHLGVAAQHQVPVGQQRLRHRQHHRREHHGQRRPPQPHRSRRAARPLARPRRRTPNPAAAASTPGLRHHPQRRDDHHQPGEGQRAVPQPRRLPAREQPRGLRRRSTGSSDSASSIARSRATSAAGTASSSKSLTPLASCPVLIRSTVSPSSRCSSRASVDTERIRLRGTDNTLRCSTPVRSCTSSAPDAVRGGEPPGQAVGDHERHARHRPQRVAGRRPEHQRADQHRDLA